MSEVAQTFLDQTLTDLDGRGLKRTLRQLSGSQGRRVTVDGRKVLNFCSNNYLGLADDARLGQAAAESIEKDGFGAGASRLVCGNMTAHQKLEEAIARFKGAESCLVFSTGYMANVGVIPALAGEGDLVVSDALNHASIIDGVRLSKAKRFRYKNSDMADLERCLRESADARSRIIATDGVFSMDGDVALLGDICDLAKKYGAWVMVD
ncbi:MAG: aminotransferase class I/II-fold pyridoxal phosphate-dependent enzyme, partial [Hyphomicrobiaceae bacterium]|nr:aminotransferase class I/II-fold pyridoxal phosphate-dependent enzyme [Hyphomicrobiaceae bacterium]